MTPEAPGAAVSIEAAGGIVRITLDRPARLNALVGDMRERLALAFAAAEELEPRVVVLTGTGRAFCAGADLGALGTLIENADAAAFERQVRAGAEVVRAIARSRAPVIAAVNGVAAGAGAALAIACDLRIAARTAPIGFTFARVGLHPDWGASYFLPRLVGPGAAAELVYSARMLDAAEAARLRLYDRVAEAGQLASTVEETARAIAAGPADAIALARRTFHADSSGLEAALEREIAAQLACFAGAEVREGVRAFLEKREPDFRSGRVSAGA
jgi:2-(1,2-epoxy-1,2-dihydrophenyl)acetyl-CoA isomerase